MNSQEKRQHKRERTLERLIRSGTRTNQTIEKKFKEYRAECGETLWFEIYSERYENTRRDHSYSKFPIRKY